MAKIKIRTRKLVYLLSGFLSLLLVYVIGEDHEQSTTFKAADLLPKEANADIPYIQNSYYTQGTYYGQSGYSCGDAGCDCGDGGGCGCGCDCGCGCGGCAGCGGGASCDCGCNGCGQGGNCGEACAGDELT